MAKTANLTVEILKQIRDEVAGTNRRLDGLGERVDALGQRLDGLSDRVDANAAAVGQRITEVELRVASELIAVGQAIDRVHDAVKARRQERDRIEDHERRIVALERKTA